MQTSTEVAKLFAALAKAQASIKAAKKDANNPAFRSKYADLASVWDAVHEALVANELALIQLPVHSEDSRVHLSTRIAHSSGEWLEETASIPVGKQDPHGYGSGLTYLRRYSASALLFLATEDDDGNAGAESAAKAVAAKAMAQSGKPGDEGKALYEAMDDQEKDFIQSYAKELRKLAADKAEDADLYLYTQRNKLDSEESLALWHVLQPDTALRSAIKRGKGAALATQA